jgi:hypothetical protein
MDRDRRERVARNEAAARDLNEKLGMGTFVCECADPDCARAVQMSRDAYDAIRSDSMLFFVVPDHELPDVEDVIDRREGYLVIRKHDDVAPLVEERDPRRKRRL